jgi:hypothetical protein
MVEKNNIVQGMSTAACQILKKTAHIRDTLAETETPTWLTWNSALVLVLGTLLVSFVLSTFRAWHRLRHVPGPFWCSVSHYWIFKRTLEGQVHENLRELFEKYGTSVTLSLTIVTLSSWTQSKFVNRRLLTWSQPGTTMIRTAPNTVALCDPDALRRINSVRGPYTRGDWYEGFKPIPEAHSTFSTLDNNHHQDLRTRSAPAVSIFLWKKQLFLLASNMELVHSM